jgi:hypothetical protein
MDFSRVYFNVKVGIIGELRIYHRSDDRYTLCICLDPLLTGCCGNLWESTPHKGPCTGELKFRLLNVLQVPRKSNSFFTCRGIGDHLDYMQINRCCSGSTRMFKQLRKLPSLYENSIRICTMYYVQPST